MTLKREAIDLQAEMSRVRGEMRQEADVLAEDVRTVTGVRYWFARYPWACVGAAVAAGFLLVPKRPKVIRPDEEMVEKLVKEDKIHVSASTGGESQAPSAFDSLLKVAATSLVQMGVSYLEQRMSEANGTSAAEADTPVNKESES